MGDPAKRRDMRCGFRWREPSGILRDPDAERAVELATRDSYTSGHDGVGKVSAWVGYG